MLNPTTDKIIQALRICSGGDRLCADCGYDNFEGDVSCTQALCMDAADRLEELEAKQPRWISVKERLPEDEKSVLVCTEHELRGKRYRLVAKAFYESGKLSTEESQYCWQEAALGEYDEESDSYKLLEGWWEDVDYTEEFGPIDRPVTHWMPLPEPPKEE